MSILTLTLEDLEVAIHQAFVSWGELADDEETMFEQFLLVQRETAALGHEASPLERRQATNRLLLQAIDELADKDETEAKVLQLRFVEGQIIRDVANRMYASTDQVNRWQRAAISDLAHILYSRESALREQRLRALEARLPAQPYTRLFGLDEKKRQAVDLLLDSEDDWVLTIAGIGGIGKTSLADAVVREVLRSLRFEEVLWLRAGDRPMSGQPLPPEGLLDQVSLMMAEQLFPDGPSLSSGDRTLQLRQEFTSRPCLVVIDNLETDENTSFILQEIREFLEPTKFVVTSRSRPTLSAPSFFLSLDELEFGDAAALLRHQAQSIGLAELAAADEKTVESIFQVTGGSPMALKMVVSLAAVLPLPKVLADLGHSQPGPIEDLYRNIYWETWRALSDDARSLLQAMPLVAEAGGLPEQIQAISGLSEEAFWPAVTELVSRSLLEVRGTVQERRYGIHRLTETFLRTEIINWQ